MQEKTAVDLATTLGDLEEARENLENAPDAQKADAAQAYLEARERSGPIFAAAQQEYDLDKAGASRPGAVPQPHGEDSEPLPTEAAPGVPLVAPPGIVVTAENLERYGPLCRYSTKDNPDAEPIEATPYAFAAGTAVTTAEGDVGVNQPSRIIKGTDAVLAIVTQDVFEATYERIEETPTPEADAPVEEAAPAGEPVEGEGAQEPGA